MKSNSDEIVRKKFENFEVDVPASSWDAISHALPEQKKSKTVLIWRRAAVAAVFLTAISTTALWFVDEDKSKVAKTTPIQENSTKTVDAIDSSSVRKVVLPSAMIAHSNEIVKDRDDSRKEHKSNASETALMHQSTVSKNETKEGETNLPLAPEQEELLKSDLQQVKSPSKKELEEFAKAGRESEEEQLVKSVKANHQNSLAWVAALPGTSNTTVNSARSLRSSTGTKNAVDILNSQQANAQNSSYTQHYYIPLSTAILFNKGISNSISIETGVRYTYLMSTQQQGSSPYFSTLTQRLHYLGVPINVNIKLLHRNRFSLYTKVGGLVEKNFAGTWNEEIKNVDGSVVYQERFNELEKVPQWSVNLGLGAQYGLNRWLSLYFEPASAYYFENGSSIDNVRKHHKFDFSLQAGFRIGL